MFPVSFMRGASRVVGMTERRIGKVTHYWPKAHAATLDLDEPLHVGDKIHVVGHGHDFVQEVRTLEIDNEPHTVLRPGEQGSVGVLGAVHAGDAVYKVEEPTYSVMSGAFGP